MRSTDDPPSPDSLADSRPAALAALTANLVLAAAKGLAFWSTGSAAMLSEALHSVGDSFNQITLMVGIEASERGADEKHPYGYGRSRWGWAVISAMGVLFIGAGVSVYNGVHTLLNQQPLDHLGWAFGVLAIAGLVEGGSFLVGARTVWRQARESETGLIETLRWGSDPVGVAVVVEDGVAVVGVVIAGAALGLSAWTGNPLWDALGSIAIGAMLGASAGFLVQRNLDLLAARAMPDSERLRVEQVLREHPLVLSITDVKTTVLGPGRTRFKAEVRFDGAALAHRFLEEEGLKGDAELAARLERFADRLVEDLGEEIDGIEARIQEAAPRVKHVDIEVDAGAERSDSTDDAVSER